MAGTKSRVLVFSKALASYGGRFAAASNAAVRAAFCSVVTLPLLRGFFGGDDFFVAESVEEVVISLTLIK
jgi:hypothetical protein